MRRQKLGDVFTYYAPVFIWEQLHAYRSRGRGNPVESDYVRTSKRSQPQNSLVERPGGSRIAMVHPIAA